MPDNFDTCFAWTMAFEDSNMACANLPDAPPGAFAISGINSRAFPSDYSSIAAEPQALRAPMVKAFYQKNFWNKWLEQIADPELAKRVFDAGVNMGADTAVKILQGSLAIHVDGVWGPLTLSEVNSAEEVVQGFIEGRKAHYDAIIKANPGNERYRAVWMTRASK